ncbi:hypothetical protein B0H11DRAFT_1311416 [Mycena galericulata]|nr:hypothetical protein B0H11DRAFT_1311416 [Mycena galericulata]
MSLAVFRAQTHHPPIPIPLPSPPPPLSSSSEEKNTHFLTPVPTHRHPHPRRARRPCTRRASGVGGWVLVMMVLAARRNGAGRRWWELGVGLENAGRASGDVEESLASRCPVLRSIFPGSDCTPRRDRPVQSVREHRDAPALSLIKLKLSPRQPSTTASCIDPRLRLHPLQLYPHLIYLFAISSFFVRSYGGHFA